MARKRIEGTALKTWDDVDAVLRRIGEIDRDLSLIESAANQAIDEVKAGAKERSEPLQVTKVALERQLKEFCDSHRADFAQVRTRELTFGSVGFRRSTAIAVKCVADTIAALKALGLAACVRTREELDKETMRELSDETLANVGAARRTKDAFGYEVKREAIPAAAVAA